MKLYVAPGACSFAPHIALREAGLAFELELVNLATKAVKSGGDFRDINPKGYVPALRLDDGQLVTEMAAILQFIADQSPASNLALPPGTMARYRVIEWVHFIGNELHKNLGWFFNAQLPEDMKPLLRELITRRYDLLQRTLEASPFLAGESLTIADPYLFTILRWTKWAGLDLARWPSLEAYVDRMKTRPSVQAAIAAEKALSL